MEKHLKQLLCIKGVCNSEERRKLHEQLMRLYEMVRQLVETLTPATSIHLEHQPQGAELGKGGNASSQRDWETGRWGESRGPRTHLQTRSTIFSRDTEFTMTLASNMRLWMSKLHWETEQKLPRPRDLGRWARWPGPHGEVPRDLGGGGNQGSRPGLEMLCIHQGPRWWSGAWQVPLRSWGLVT